jgi:hypothetical protein
MGFGGDPRLRLVAGLLVLIALVGYLIGHRHSSPAPASSSRSITDAGVLLEHPASWRVSHLPPADGALGSLRQLLVLAPAGRSTEAGLVVGLLPAAARGPLPPALLARAAGDPRAEVVLMVAGVQAYRYSRVALIEPALRVTAYSIPTVASHTVVVLCYTTTATASAAKAEGECEQIAEALTPLQAEPKELAPYGHPAGLLDAALHVLVAQRAAIRSQMYAAAASSSRLASLATQMADVFAAARRTLSSFPSLLPDRSQMGLALIESLSAVQRAYLDLGAAAANAQSARYTSARSKVYTAEASLQNALNSLALLGY